MALPAAVAGVETVRRLEDCSGGWREVSVGIVPSLESWREEAAVQGRGDGVRELEGSTCAGVGDLSLGRFGAAEDAARHGLGVDHRRYRPRGPAGEIGGATEDWGVDGLRKHCRHVDVGNVPQLLAEAFAECPDGNLLVT